MEGQAAFLKYVKEFVTALSTQVIPAVLAELKNTGAEIKQNAEKAWSDFQSNIEKTPPENFSLEEVELLKYDKLMSIATSNIVEGSDEVYAWKKTEDDNVIISLAYGKDGELIDAQNNRFITIKASAVTADVLQLFGDDDIVILK
jgi:hypothetical protein